MGAPSRSSGTPSKVRTLLRRAPVARSDRDQSRRPEDERIACKHNTTHDRRPIRGDQMNSHIFDVLRRKAVTGNAVVNSVPGKPDSSRSAGKDALPM